MIKHIYTLMGDEGHYIKVKCCDYCEYGDRKISLYGIMGNITINDNGKRVFYNEETEHFSVENDEQTAERLREI